MKTNSDFVYVDVFGFMHFKKKGFPNKYFSRIEGVNIKVVSNSQMKHIIAEFSFTDTKTGAQCKETGEVYVTQIKWNADSGHEACGT